MVHVNSTAIKHPDLMRIYFATSIITTSNLTNGKVNALEVIP